MITNESSEILLSVEHVGLAYLLRKDTLKRTRHHALKDITFELRRGDSLGIIGRNGCGKSSLLRLLAGVMSPDMGRIVAKPNLRISLLTLQLGFVDYLSGRENVILSGMFLGMKKHEVLERLDLIIEFAELGEFIDQPLASYSSGMRARLGFSVAFQLDPDIILVDEVLGVGDAEFQAKSVEVMKERIKSADSTVVFVSHSESMVKTLCNKAIWIEDGMIRRSGDAADVVDAYETALAENYVRRICADYRQGLPLFIRKKGSDTIHMVRDKKLVQLQSWKEFVDAGGRSDAIRVVLPEVFRAMQDERQIDRVMRQLEADIFCFVRPVGKKAIFAVRGDTLVPVESWDEFLRLGGDASIVREVSIERFLELRDKGTRSLHEV